MQVTNTAALPATPAGTAAASAPAAPSASPPPDSGAAQTNAPAVRVSLSAAAQAYLDQPDPPSIAEVARNKKKPKMKTLLELMLEWSRKYAAQREQREKGGHPLSPQNAASGDSASNS